MRIAALVVLALVVAPATAAAPRRVLKLGWHESKALPSDGVHPKGELDFAVARVTVTPTRWTVAATIRNRSEYDVRVYLHDVSPTGFPPAICCGTFSWMGIDGYELLPDGVRGFHLHRATRYSPPLPSTLKPHATWTGTFSGTAPLPRRTDLRVSFGVFRIESLTWGAPVVNEPWMNAYFTWITDETFRL